MCVAQMTKKPPRLPVSIKIMCARVKFLCESIRDFFFSLFLFSFPLSYCSSLEWLKPQSVSVCTVILTETQGSGIKSAGKLLTRRLSSANSPPPAGDVCPYKWRERVFCPPHPLYCKMSNTGVCVCVRASVCLCACRVLPVSVAFSFPPNRKQHLTLFHRYKLQTYAHTHTHVHTHARTHKQTHTFARLTSDSYEPEL